MLSGDEMARRLGVSRMTVNTWRQEGRLVGMAGVKRGYRFPEWQLDAEGRPFAELPKLHALLGGAWAVWRFLSMPHAELGGTTGHDALVAGRSEDVLGTAESIARGTFA
ncbi:helix-turn-helix domain-containing protein [Salinarimonas ramus]|nr:helix-turn-helix domain-containing protein [Salinarimonas ramus]